MDKLSPDDILILLDGPNIVNEYKKVGIELGPLADIISNPDTYDLNTLSTAELVEYLKAMKENTESMKIIRDVLRKMIIRTGIKQMNQKPEK